MPTILELAQHADLPAETVLRVILREPTSEAAKRAVAAAVAELGPPDYPRPNGNIEVVSDEPESAELAVPEPTLPAEPALDEALVAEVRRLVDPAAEQVLQLRALFEELIRRVSAERRERVEDLELMTELMIEGWKNVDRRLGRIEKIVGRLSESQAGPPAPKKERGVVRLEDWVKQPFGESGSDRS